MRRRQSIKTLVESKSKPKRYRRLFNNDRLRCCAFNVVKLSIVFDFFFFQFSLINAQNRRCSPICFVILEIVHGYRRAVKHLKIFVFFFVRCNNVIRQYVTYLRNVVLPTYSDFLSRSQLLFFRFIISLRSRFIAVGLIAVSNVLENITH